MIPLLFDYSPLDPSDKDSYEKFNLFEVPINIEELLDHVSKDYPDYSRPSSYAHGFSARGHYMERFKLLAHSSVKSTISYYLLRMYFNETKDSEAYIAQNMYGFFHLIGKEYNSILDADRLMLAKYFSIEKICQLEWGCQLFHNAKLSEDLQKYYKDHLIHSFSVTVIGCFLLNHLKIGETKLVSTCVENIKQEKTARFFCDELGISKDQFNEICTEDSILLAWQITGLMHDIGYYLELPGKLVCDYNYDTNDGKHHDDHFKLFYKDSDVRYIKILNNYRKEEKELVNRVFVFFNEKISENASSFFETRYKGKEKEKREWSIHEYWSAMEIASRYLELKNNEKIKVKLKFALLLSISNVLFHHISTMDMNLTFKMQPLSYLLRALDESQSVGRHSLIVNEGGISNIVDNSFLFHMPSPQSLKDEGAEEKLRLELIFKNSSSPESRKKIEETRIKLNNLTKNLFLNSDNLTQFPIKIIAKSIDDFEGDKHNSFVKSFKKMRGDSHAK